MPSHLPSCPTCIHLWLRFLVLVLWGQKLLLTQRRIQGTIMKVLQTCQGSDSQSAHCVPQAHFSHSLSILTPLTYLMQWFSPFRDYPVTNWLNCSAVCSTNRLTETSVDLDTEFCSLKAKRVMKIKTLLPIIMIWKIIMPGQQELITGKLHCLPLEALSQCDPHLFHFKSFQLQPRCCT